MNFHFINLLFPMSLGKHWFNHSYAMNSYTTFVYTCSERSFAKRTPLDYGVSSQRARNVSQEGADFLGHKTFKQCSSHTPTIINVINDLKIAFSWFMKGKREVATLCFFFNFIFKVFFCLALWKGVFCDSHKSCSHQSILTQSFVYPQEIDISIRWRLPHT